MQLVDLCRNDELASLIAHINSLYLNQVLAMNHHRICDLFADTGLGLKTASIVPAPVRFSNVSSWRGAIAVECAIAAKWRLGS